MNEDELAMQIFLRIIGNNSIVNDMSDKHDKAKGLEIIGTSKALAEMYVNYEAIIAQNEPDQS